MCGVGKSLKERWRTTPRRVKFWLLGGVLPTFVTLAVVVFCDMWVGYTLLQALSNHFLDFCLASFTLAVSIFGAALDLERQIEEDKRLFVIFASAFLWFLGSFLFLILYLRKIHIEKQMEDFTSRPLLVAVHVAVVIVAFLVIQTGIFLEQETNSPSA